jgi:protein-tyrosine phosphatase
MAWVEFPDGVRIRGRGLRGEAPSEQRPDWSLYLLGRAPADTGSPGRWVRWPDLWLPLSAEDARSAFEEAHRLAADGLRVELACGGGTGRTGTALACIAQIGGVPAKDAIEWTRRHYNPRAIETPWQRRYVRRFNRTGGARF